MRYSFLKFIHRSFKKNHQKYKWPRRQDHHKPQVYSQFLSTINIHSRILVLEAKKECNENVEEFSDRGLQVLFFFLFRGIRGQNF